MSNFVNPSVSRYSLEFNDSESLNKYTSDGLCICRETGTVGVVHPHSDGDVERLLVEGLLTLIESGAVKAAVEYMRLAYDGATEDEYDILDIAFRTKMRTQIERLIRKLPMTDLKSGRRMTKNSMTRYLLMKKGLFLLRLIEDRTPEDALEFKLSDDVPMELIEAYENLQRIIKLVSERNKAIKARRYHKTRQSRKANGYRYNKTSKERPRFLAYQWETIDEGLLDKPE
jgi:hypothetical protein